MCSDRFRKRKKQYEKIGVFPGNTSKVRKKWTRAIYQKVLSAKVTFLLFKFHIKNGPRSAMQSEESVIFLLFFKGHC